MQQMFRSFIIHGYLGFPPYGCLRPAFNTQLLDFHALSKKLFVLMKINFGLKKIYSLREIFAFFLDILGNLSASGKWGKVSLSGSISICMYIGSAVS